MFVCMRKGLRTHQWSVATGLEGSYVLGPAAEKSCAHCPSYWPAGLRNSILPVETTRVDSTMVFMYTFLTTWLILISQRRE